MIFPGEATRVGRLVPAARIIQLPGLGHLAHEEAPARIGELVLAHARAQGVAVPS
jgi:magnesium chelatase accessory protein